VKSVARPAAVGKLLLTALPVGAVLGHAAVGAVLVHAAAVAAAAAAAAAAAVLLLAQGL